MGKTQLAGGYLLKPKEADEFLNKRYPDEHRDADNMVTQFHLRRWQRSLPDELRFSIPMANCTYRSHFFP